MIKRAEIADVVRSRNANETHRVWHHEMRTPRARCQISVSRSPRLGGLPFATLVRSAYQCPRQRLRCGVRGLLIPWADPNLLLGEFFVEQTRSVFPPASVPHSFCVEGHVG